MRPLPRWVDFALLPLLNVVLAFLVGGLIVLALTWLTVSIVDWFQILQPRGRLLLAVLCLLVYSVWIIGWPR